MKKIVSVTALSVVAVLGVTGCASSPEALDAPAAAPAAPAADSLEALIDAAKAEGSLRVYASTPEQTLAEIVDAFTAEYGIEVEALRLGGASMPSRFEAETSAGTSSGEVLIASQLDFLLNATEDGDLLSFADTGVEGFLSDYPREGVLSDYADLPILQVLDTGFVYNTDAIAADELPDEWSDLADPRWAGRYCAVAPDTSESQMIFMDTIRASGGEEALQSFGENIGRWYPGIIPLNEAVVAGECDLAAGSAQYFIAGAMEKGAPVDFAHAPTAVFPVTSAAVSTAADHPNAAKLFLHFVLSTEGNALLNDLAVGSIGPWDYGKLPEAFWVPSVDDQDRVRETTDEIMSLLGL